VNYSFKLDRHYITFLSYVGNMSHTNVVVVSHLVCLMVVTLNKLDYWHTVRVESCLVWKNLMFEFILKSLTLVSLHFFHSLRHRGYFL